MNVKVPTTEEKTVAKPSLLGKFKDTVQQSLSAISQHCDAVEKSKEAADRENLAKNGKDWVNRCCG